MRQKNTGFGISQTALKYIAVVAMTMNHVARAFMNPNTVICNVFIWVGLIAAPIMCYCAVQGYHYTTRLREYLIRLLICGVAAQIPYLLAFNIIQLNVIFTLMICIGVLWVKDHLDGWRKWVLLAAGIALSSICDWGILLPIFALLVDYTMPPAMPDKAGRAQQLFFYIYYPAHLAVICIIKAVIR